jgi:hypothetical protein
MSPGLDRYFRRAKPPETEPKEEEPCPVVSEGKTAPTRDWWAILQETVRSMVLFPHHMAYTRDHILPTKPSITPEELAIQLDIPLGVALVILDQLKTEQHQPKR